MGFDPDALTRATRQHGRVARVVIADVKGSSPREVGAAMLVWRDGQSGTIGGGALEHELSRRARANLDTRPQARLSHHALGPEMGQCCGGAVQVVTEWFDADALPRIDSTYYARCVSGTADTHIDVQRALAVQRNGAAPCETRLVQGWLIEPVYRPTRQLWVWGAGHVGRAVVTTLAPLPEFAITWVDTAPDRFPDLVPETVTQMPANDPARLARHAPADAEHLILTYSHALDLELCHQLLCHDFAFAGLIGSKSKWARFQNRLRDLGHSAEQISRVTCPIGDPALGKHPQAIAISVASELLSNAAHAIELQGLRA